MIDLGTNIEPTPTKPTRAARKPASATDTVKIILEENESIPPTGLFISHNGRPYIIRAGEEVTIPKFLQEILDTAVMSSPVVDPSSQQVIGYRDRLRYSYRIVQ